MELKNWEFTLQMLDVPLLSMMFRGYIMFYHCIPILAALIMCHAPNIRGTSSSLASTGTASAFSVQSSYVQKLGPTNGRILSVNFWFLAPLLLVLLCGGENMHGFRSPELEVRFSVSDFCCAWKPDRLRK
jgi:hypothetical protein